MLLLFCRIVISCAWATSLADLSLNAFYIPKNGLQSAKNYVKIIAFLVACKVNKKYGPKHTVSESSAAASYADSGCSDCHSDVRDFTVSVYKHILGQHGYNTPLTHSRLLPYISQFIAELSIRRFVTWNTEGRAPQ